MTAGELAPVADDLAAEAWQHIRSISNDPVTVATSHRIMHETELTGGPMKALRFLPLTGSLPMRQLAGRMGCDNSYVTSLVDTLEQRGLAGREAHPTDRRIKVIVLTEEGRRLAERVQRAYTTPPAAFSTLSEAEVTRLCELLRKLDPAQA
ncbi:MAG TPA: MarR family transcriptional regulator [Pseudonocardiaceae bacterium]|nr:MarR family transcriptional regulator [Pseudonocardiaceae bacterium]